jgi:hypothetical protein
MFCCGIPALAVTLAAVTGAAASSVVGLSGAFGALHAAIHGHELWILAVSALLVSGGGAMEFLSRRGGRELGFPWLYAMSLCCFVVNVAIIGVHRLL